MSKKMTNNDIKKITNSLKSDEAIEWFKENENLLIGLSNEDTKNILRDSVNEKAMMGHYDAIVAEMTWKERIEFLELGIEQMKQSTNRKIRTLLFIRKVEKISRKLLPIILAVL